MANIPLKTIKFPGLANTYTIPEVSTDLTASGKAAEAAKVGAELATLGDQLDTNTEDIDKLKADLPAQRYIKDYPNGCILDKEGNVILRGGIDVKQTSRYIPQYPGGAVFDAEGRLMLVGESQYNPLKGLKVSIIGDSISSYEGWIPTGYARAYPDNDTVDNVNKMWWKRLIDMSGMELCVNAAWSGSRVSGNLLTDQTAKPACSNQRIADLTNPTTGEKPNIVICFIGTNDWSSGIDIGDFDSTSEIPEDGNITEISTAYALMLYKIRTSYPNAHIFCIPPLSRNLLNSSLATDDSYPILNNNGESIHQISKKIEDLALLFGATVINMERMGMSYWNISKYLRSDTLHPNAAGMEMIAVRCYKVIKDYFRGLEF